MTTAVDRTYFPVVVDGPTKEELFEYLLSLGNPPYKPLMFTFEDWGDGGPGRGNGRVTTQLFLTGIINEQSTGSIWYLVVSAPSKDELPDWLWMFHEGSGKGVIRYFTDVPSDAHKGEMPKWLNNGTRTLQGY